MKDANNLIQQNTYCNDHSSFQTDRSVQTFCMTIFWMITAIFRVSECLGFLRYCLNLISHRKPAAKKPMTPESKSDEESFKISDSDSDSDFGGKKKKKAPAAKKPAPK